MRETVAWEDAIEVPCPRCGAFCGEVCRDDGTPRKSCHVERHGEAIAGGVRVRYRDGHRVRYGDELPGALDAPAFASVETGSNPFPPSRSAQ
jgi:hypothetical protein